MLRSSTRLSRFSIDQASSPITNARTIRPLPLRVWKARRTSLNASLLAVSARHCGRYSAMVSNTSPASSTNTSSSSSSTGSSSTGGGNKLGGTSCAGGLIACTGAAITSAMDKALASTTAGVCGCSAMLGNSTSGNSSSASSASLQCAGASSTFNSSNAKAVSGSDRSSSSGRSSGCKLSRLFSGVSKLNSSISSDADKGSLRSQ